MSKKINKTVRRCSKDVEVPKMSKNDVRASDASEEVLLIHWRVAGADQGKSNIYLPPCRAIACSHFHTLALTTEGMVLSWGRGALGLLGLGNEDDALTPQRITSLGASNMAVACGPYHSAVITKDGRVCTYGWLFAVNSTGVVEQTFVTLPEPTAGFPRGVSLVGVACGCYATAVWTASGMLFTWGRGASGQLGHGATDVPLDPQPQCLKPAARVSSWGVASNNNHSPGAATSHPARPPASLMCLLLPGEYASPTHADSLCTRLSMPCMQDEPLPRRVEALAQVRVSQAVLGGVQSHAQHSGFLLALTTSGKVFSCGNPGR